ncbi:MAG: efflux RND transporter periplasmic adaptor subunit [Geobacteraceae bacterium]|nr:efflux RND transporter periplasmic adaptor subunit [Geobacteraceae bacterium]
MNPRIRNSLIGGAVVLAVIITVLVLKQIPVQSQTATVASKAVLSVTEVLPQQKQWPMRLAADGSIIAWKEAIISAETGGLRITALHADIGNRVKRGQLLAELARDSVNAEVRRYEAALASAKASLAQAKANADRARLVRGTGAVSEQQINEYLATEQTAKANVDLAEAQLSTQKVTLAQTRIVAVDDGLITARNALLGQVVSSGAELFRLQRQGRLEWQAEVDAKQLAIIKPGLTAEVTLPSGKLLQGTVRLVAPTLSTNTSRANVLVSLPADSAANAGMFTSGYILAGSQSALTVPESAVVLRDGNSYVFEIGNGNKVVRRVVSTGQHRDGLVEIASGLNAQARVVGSGGAFLADGDLVTVVGKETK